MSILLAAHSGVRWLVILIALVVLVKFIWGWIGKKPYEAIDRTLTKVFAGVVDLQVLLGIIYLLWNGFAGAGFPRYRIEHAVTMILAAVAAHFAGRGKGSSDSAIFRNATIAVLVTLLLIYAGVAVLPGGWSR
jgi:hypothetical protein